MLIVDTGVLLAAADESDRDHAECVELLEGSDGPLVTTPLVVAEASYLIDRQLGPRAEAGFFRSLAAGDLRVEVLDLEDWARISELIERYSDLPLGGTDASLVVIADRFETKSIATLDRRHFSVVQPKTGASFELVP